MVIAKEPFSPDPTGTRNTQILRNANIRRGIIKVNVAKLGRLCSWNSMSMWYVLYRRYFLLLRLVIFHAEFSVYSSRVTLLGWSSITVVIVSSET
jgi:hypothetical protein